jgi:hypothetical protein
MQIIHYLSRTKKRVPLLVPFNFILSPDNYIEDVNDCCGSGGWLKQALVPETMYGLRISMACAIHDEMFSSAPPTYEAFYIANAVMCFNLLIIISTLSKSKFMMALRIINAMGYFMAVNVSIPALNTFWQLKYDQHHTVPEYAMKYVKVDHDK